MTIRAHAARAAGGRLEPFAYEPAELGPLDVEIDVACCGLCHSDVHLIDDTWKISAFPLVAGHEIIGTVSARGAAVTHLAPGQRVGAGWQRSACLACGACLGGDENLCSAQEATCVGHHGGLAEKVRIDARFAFPIPDELTSEEAAPLMCGGVTVYAPLRRFGVDATKSVGVIGIGGLGHLALLFLRALGCEVTAFSSSPDKADEARRMGASHFVGSSDVRALKARAGTLDLLLSTVHARLDWISYLRTLRPNGVLCLLGAPPGLIGLPATALFEGQRSITASEIGGRAAIAGMLAFAARHRIAAQVEVAPMGDVNAALDRLRQNRARYRMVVENR
jgi:alcohol/geraniol dehydrogenase (NADP+)